MDTLEDRRHRRSWAARPTTCAPDERNRRRRASSASVKSYVFSRTLPDARRACNIVREDVAAFVRRLKGAEREGHLRHGRRRAGALAVRGRTSSIASGSTSIRCCSAPACPCSMPMTRQHSAGARGLPPVQERLRLRRAIGRGFTEPRACPNESRSAHHRLRRDQRRRVHRAQGRRHRLARSAHIRRAATAMGEFFKSIDATPRARRPTDEAIRPAAAVR